ncbi:unnamed protein product [Didymodactylos carnosus]|uniref:Uncharacterized protein n=1 Tax=Didymodactylos carnosus TaxID=1234261 RepID=A0A813XDB5_9BILA|nr:unnamed protein product [Didymodactylos carnosus]CAF3654043.1 unnamed protein product [Didymodactylos carnosus]
MLTNMPRLLETFILELNSDVNTASYCKAPNESVCAKCEEGHRTDDCDKAAAQPVYHNCKEPYLTMSDRCPKYKQNEGKIKKPSDEYSPQHQAKQTPLLWLNDQDAFPPLTVNKQQQHYNQSEPYTIEKVFERLLDVIDKGFQQLTKQLKKEINSYKREQQQQKQELAEEDEVTTQKNTNSMLFVQQHKQNKKNRRLKLTPTLKSIR